MISLYWRNIKRRREVIYYSIKKLLNSLILKGASTQNRCDFAA